MTVANYQLLALLLQVQRSYEGSTTCGQRFLIQVPTVRFPSYDFYNPRVTFLMVTDSPAAEVSLFFHKIAQERGPDSFILEHLVLQRTPPLPAELLPKEYKGHVWAFEFVSNMTDFCLCVHIVITPESTLRWMVLPVAGWGLNYYVVTFHYAPSITLIAAEESSVNIKIKHTNSKRTVTKFGKSVLDSNMLTVSLKRNEAYNLGMCENIITAVGTLTGTYISSTQPIGVIHGSCYQHYTVIEDCRTPDESQLAFGRKEMISDMAPPVESYGREFITVPKNISKLARYMALASEANTTVDVYSMKTTTVLKNAGEFEYIVVSYMPTKVSSSKAILLVLVASSLCNKVYISDVSPALVYIVPVNLYYFDYILCIDPSEHLQHEVLFIAPRFGTEFIVLDNERIRNAPWSSEEGKSDWFFVTVPLNATPTCHQAVMTANSRFGCYMYGFNTSERHTGYLLPVSYISSPINTPCQESIPMIGDLEDNDCDMMIDEERMDMIDDDNDLKIDEDTGIHHGYWGEWTSWVCSKNCSDANIYRYRACDNPAPSIKGRNCTGMTSESRPELCHQNRQCPGHVVDHWTPWSQWSCSQVDCTDTRLFQIRSCNHSSPKQCVGDTLQYKDSSCYINVTCPKDCPVGTWGPNCKGRCRNCEPDCDKFNGTCEFCQPGFQYPNRSCNSECSPMRYGFNCREDCYIKCKTDCKERVTGICPSGLSQFLPMVLLIPIIPLTVLFLLGKKMSLTEKDENSSDGLNLTIVRDFD